LDREEWGSWAAEGAMECLVRVEDGREGEGRAGRYIIRKEKKKRKGRSEKGGNAPNAGPSREA